MNKGVIGVTFILGFLLSGYLGYQANDFKRTYETVKTAKSDDIVDMNDEETHHDVEILTDITYWIDGVQIDGDPLSISLRRKSGNDRGKHERKSCHGEIFIRGSWKLCERLDDSRSSGESAWTAT